MKHGPGNLCPRCDKTMTPFIGFRAGLVYECKNCGYRGPISIKKEGKK